MYTTHRHIATSVAVRLSSVLWVFRFAPFVFHIIHAFIFVSCHSHSTYDMPRFIPAIPFTVSHNILLSCCCCYCCCYHPQKRLHCAQQKYTRIASCMCPSSFHVPADRIHYLYSIKSVICLPSAMRTSYTFHWPMQTAHIRRS